MEIGVRVTRDVKGFSNIPYKRLLYLFRPLESRRGRFLLISRCNYRPQHGIYKDIKPLFANPILPLLVIALADRVF